MTTTPTASPELPDLDRVHLLHSQEQDILLMANYHALGEDDGNYYFAAGGLLALMARAIAQYGHLARRAQPAGEAPQAESFQQRVQPWMMACFGAEISADKVERNDRFTEESLELVQACGMTKDRVLALVDYVYDRPLGEPAQEVGGVMVTLAALCLAQGLRMHDAAEVELARIWTKVEAIRAKQLTKPRGSPLPIPAGTLSPLCGAQQAETGKEAALRKINDIRNSIIGLQALNWSEHVYPLVAALDEAGYEGMDYPDARANYGTLLERAVKAEDALAAQQAAPCPYCGGKDGQHDRAYPHPRAAQQAAAPGSLDDQVLVILTLGGIDGGEYGDNDIEIASSVRLEDLQRKLVHTAESVEIELIVRPVASAPGTPEAPKDERKGIELWRATLRACGELPEGYEVRIELENGCGMAVWYDAEGERHVIDGEGYLSDDVNEAVDAAIQRAAQLDGGQEGSE